VREEKIERIKRSEKMAKVTKMKGWRSFIEGLIEGFFVEDFNVFKVVKM